MTEYRIIAKQGKEIGYEREYKFYEGEKMLKMINGHLGQIPFLGQEHLFLIKIARAQEHVLDEDKKIKSIETKIITN
jgi:hypothetical protein